MALKFRKTLIADEKYESCGVFDVNGDGKPDIVSGAWWYEGPDFKKRRRIGDVQAIGADYFDDFSTIPMDIAGSGRLDFVTGGWWGNTLRWRENPGDPDKQWPEHIIAETGNIETTKAWDVDGDGKLEIVPNCPGAPLKVFKLAGPGKFDAHTIWEEQQGHGLGCGDLAGNGRMDFVLHNGWLEAPADTYNGKWTWHPDFEFGSASVPILVVDVNGDGLNDIIVGGAHQFGLDWYEQVRDSGGRVSWKKHPIDPFNSQYHDMQWIDIDGDGACELVTGKRYMAHCGNDPGEWDDVGIYYFKWTGEGFSKQVIDYGPARVATGTGIFFEVADLRGSGRLDIVAPGKDGLYAFFNEG
jgi:hypothetical protein